MTHPNEYLLGAGTPGVYVRHRPRMVRESVYQDLRDTLIRTGWLAGSTRDALGRLPEDPTFDASTAYTLPANQTFALLEGDPLNLIDYFPESHDGETPETPMNTFALDIGEQGEREEGELGGGYYEQPYSFNMAFYAKTDAVAMALMSDLHDRYHGVTESPYISLYNFLGDPPTLVVRMEVENFRYARDLTNVAPHEVHLFFGGLEITDYVDQVERAFV